MNERIVVEVGSLMIEMVVTESLPFAVHASKGDQDS